MPAGICFIYFYIYRSSQERCSTFFQFTGEHPCRSVSSTKNIIYLWFNSTEITVLYWYSSVNMQHICSRTPFLENTSEELILCTAFNIEVINVEVLHKQVKY